ncbi:phage holin family protein [Celerinatantimonas diazotrophica]|uniref:Putative superfamily III holin-X n=1 Tax=Celerinatantimonas diazotrophica TaxID=412034 RepID=A0A4V2PNG5_9GAMM|nr:phage holin family protein [Celerinatantimonas diazotrophica]TCK46971.1 putative superfamily III holin-X [Celerinatantimonas diazotrophica]CAG9295739.1 hypothetical protein CEDIAZO_00865 [Celerinatantimonas diazotrophica]
MHGEIPQQTEQTHTPFSNLLSIYQQWFENWLKLAELESQYAFSNAIKVLILSIAAVVILLSGWGLFLAFVISVGYLLGISLVWLLAIGTFVHLILAFALWRLASVYLARITFKRSAQALMNYPQNHQESDHGL